MKEYILAEGTFKIINDDPAIGWVQGNKGMSIGLPTVHYQEFMSPEEIQQILDIPVGTHAKFVLITEEN